jgi:hypothetical protein
MTPTELVLEFGSFFPDRPNTSPPSDYKPDARVVMNIGVLQGFADALKKAAEARTTAVADTTKKPVVGFTQ